MYHNEDNPLRRIQVADIRMVENLARRWGDRGIPESELTETEEIKTTTYYSTPLNPRS